ncbi:hypothetical protein XENTR_v10013766 [Xenopus tropicalis]|nr:hypothetical protein XENTR_v10013766 [Xenopus tropicalis]
MVWNICSLSPQVPTSVLLRQMLTEKREKSFQCLEIHPIPLPTHSYPFTPFSPRGRVVLRGWKLSLLCGLCSH